MKRVLETTVSIEEECCRLERSLIERYGEEIASEEKKVSDLRGRHQRLQTSADDVMARLFSVEDQLEFLQSEHQKEGVDCTAAVAKQDDTLAGIQQACQQLQNIIEIKDNPERQMPVPPLTFNLMNFEVCKEENEIWASTPFYSHPYGYKMCLRVFSNGFSDGFGTHVSAYVAILPGEFDDLLTWPFCGVVTFQLLNQRKDRGHVIHTVNFDIPENIAYRLKPDPNKVVDPAQATGWGCHSLAAHASLPAEGYFSETEYLKNDTLQFRVSSVRVYNLHH